jgi:hypothetical protein
MEPGSFFYSINGTDVHGPVTDLDVRQLWQDNRIGPGSFLCRAGEMTWTPCNPDDYPPQVRRARTMSIVPSQMVATLLAAEEASRREPDTAPPSSVAVALEPPEDEIAKQKRVTIRLSSLPEVLEKVPAISRSRSGRIPLTPSTARAPREATKSSPAGESQPLLDALFQPPVAATPRVVEGPQKLPAMAKAAAAPAPAVLPVEAPTKSTADSKPTVLARGGLAPPPVAKSASFYAGALALVAGWWAKDASSAPKVAPRPAEPAAPRTTASPVPREIPALAVAAHVPPPLPAEAPPSASAGDEVVDDEEEPAQELGDFAIVLNCLAAVAALAASALSSYLAQPPAGSAFFVFAYRDLAFTGTLLAVVLIPYVLSRFTAGDARVITRSGGMVVLAVLISMLYLVRPALPPGNEARALTQQQKQSQQQKQEAQKEIASKGYYAGNSDQAEQNIEKLKGQLTDNSERSRIGRAILTVTAELLDKVKASDAVEKTCKFTLDGVTGTDDLAARNETIQQLRAAQADVISFLQNYDEYCHQAMSSDNIAAATQDAVVASARKGAHTDLLITLWQAKMKLSGDYVTRFDFLRKNWGQLQIKDGEVGFIDDKQAAAYNALVQVIQDDIAKIHDTQRLIFQ